MESPDLSRWGKKKVFARKPTLSGNGVFLFLPQKGCVFAGEKLGKDAQYGGEQDSVTEPSE